VNRFWRCSCPCEARKLRTAAQLTFPVVMKPVARSGARLRTLGRGVISNPQVKTSGKRKGDKVSGLLEYPGSRG
jgi:hypothetical protein